MTSEQTRPPKKNGAQEDPGEFERARQDVDEYDDPRSLEERQEDAATELRRLRDTGEISQEDYEERMSELEQSVQDTERVQELDKERPPGEIETGRPPEA